MISFGKRGLKIIVVGAGKVGDTLVNRLAEEGHDLVIIDKNVDRLTELANLCDCMGVIGNGASHEVLEEAGVSNADLFIAVTESDELNLLCCTIAKQFNKKLATIARVRNPDYGKEIPYLRSKLSLEMIINPEYEAAVKAASAYGADWECRWVSCPMPTSGTTSARPTPWAAATLQDRPSHRRPPTMATADCTRCTWASDGIPLQD